MALPATTYDIATATNPSSALTDFTFIVDLSLMSDAWWAAVDTTDGTKGRASKSDGTTELACDWIDFDSTAETGILRVKYTGTLASTGTQEVRIYPPISTNVSYGVTDTYGQYNAYDSAWLLYSPDGGTADRTTNQNNGTAFGSVSSGGVSGKIGKATDFDGIDDYIEYANIDNNESTIVTTFNSDVLDYTTQLGTNKVDGDNLGSILKLRNDGSVWLRYGFGTSRRQIIVASGYSVGVWVDANMVLSQSSPNAEIYLNGVSGGTNSDGAYSPNTTEPFSVAKNYEDSYFNGKCQNIQFHNIARASSWLSEEYLQIDDNATFWGTWTNVPVGSSGAISGTSTGESTVSGILKGSGALIGSSTGVSTAEGILKGYGTLAGSSDGTSTVTATIKGAGKLFGLSEGDCTVTGTLTGTSTSGNLHGNISGSSTVSGVLKATGKLSGEIAGTCVVSGTLIGKTAGELSGLSEGSCTVTGNIYNTSGGAVGLITITLTASAPTLTISGTRPNINIKTGI